MKGHLDLVCAVDADGRSHLSRQSFCAPVHLSKPHWDENALVVNVVNPTAGLFAGDHLRYDVAVENRAHLLLTSPSASRAYKMPTGEAVVEQHFQVSDGGLLEVMPEYFIPQAGCRYRQRTELEVAQGGSAIFFETLAPGRVAAGEAFDFDRLEWTTLVRWDGRLVARERYRIEGGESPSLAALRAPFPCAYYLSCLLIGTSFAELPPPPDQEDFLLGYSRLPENAGWAIRVLARDSIALRRVQRWLREQIYAGLGLRPPALRRY
ncbi:MAG: urease accessory protein UreD [Chthoniobacteraceae bacterium]